MARAPLSSPAPDRLRVAICGRPNVGKSTLFNRLAGKKLALVDDTPGVTRDWRSAPGSVGGLKLTVIDTAGLEEAFDDSLEARMRRQTERALEQADVVLLLVDSRAGVTPMDAHFAAWLRRQSRPVILVANKCEGRPGLGGWLEAHELGLGEPVPISAEHGEGMADLVAALLPHVPPEIAAAEAAQEALEEESRQQKKAARKKRPAKTGFLATAGGVSPSSPSSPSSSSSLPSGTGRSAIGEGDGIFADPAFPELLEADLIEEPDDPGAPLHLAIVGRPNVGKSTLLNALVGEERVLTGPEAGMTRDAISVDGMWQGRYVRLVDTAGLRRKARVDGKLEKLAVADALRVIRLAQVVILVLDAEAILDKQDLTIARMVENEGRGLVIAINKWDRVADRAAAIRQLQDRLETSLTQVKGLRTVTLSALLRQRVDAVLDAAFATYDTWKTRVPTAKLNRWLGDALVQHPPPLVNGRRIKIRYMTQLKARPPTFALWVNKPVEMPESYLRYLVNGLREAFDLPGVPIRMMLRKPKNPYADG